MNAPTMPMQVAKPAEFYAGITDPLQAVRELGDALAEAKFMGCSNKAQGRILAWECLTNRVSPLSMTKTYHIIQDKLSMKADAMLARFQELGGSAKIISRTEDLAAIELTFEGNTNRFEVAWESFKKEPVPYQGKEGEIVAKLLKGEFPALKPKYATPHSRMQMLWARVVSDAVRAICPRVNAGAYTPEETEEFMGTTVEGKAETVSSDAQAEAVLTKLFPATSETSTTLAERPAEKSPVSAPVEAKQETKSETTKEEYCTKDQAIQINCLFDGLQLSPEQREKALKKRNASNVRGLRFDAAEELIAAMEEKRQQLIAARAAKAKQDEEEAAKHPEVVPAPLNELAGEETALSANSHDCVARPEEVEICKALLETEKQRDPQINAKVKAKLVESNVGKLANLASRDIQALITGLKAHDISAWTESTFLEATPF